MKWISIKDKLPKKEQRVIVYIPYFSKVCIGELINFKGKLKWDIELYFDLFNKTEVSHWAPLPALPSESPEEITLTKKWLEREKVLRGLQANEADSQNECFYYQGRLDMTNELIRMMEEK